jgi:hypothetical protein
LEKYLALRAKTLKADVGSETEERICLMNRLMLSILVVLWIGLCCFTTQAETYDCIDIVLCGNTRDGSPPDWILSAKSEEGVRLEQDGSWVLKTSSRDKHSRIVLSLDRTKLNGDIGLSLIYDGDASADVALQLLNDMNEVVVVDLVGNAISAEKNKSLRTFAISLRKHPSATRIAIQQVSGKVAIHGIVLFPLLIGDGNETDMLAQIDMLKILHQQLSPRSPTWRKIEQIMTEKDAANSQDQSERQGPFLPKTNLSSSNSPVDENSKHTSTPQIDARTYFDFSNETFGEVRIGSSIRDVIQAYGKKAFPTYAGEVIAERPYIGSYRNRYDYRYRAKDTVIHTIDGKVANIFSWSKTLRTDKGLAKGDSRDRLIQLYGQPESAFNSGKALNYYFDDIRAVIFITKDDKVSHIEVLKREENKKNSTN